MAIAKDDWHRWLTCLHESGHVCGFLNAGILPHEAFASDGGLGEVNTDCRLKDFDEEKLQIAAVAGPLSVLTFSNAEAAPSAEMSRADWAIYNSHCVGSDADALCARDGRVFEIRKQQAQTLLLAHERFVLKCTRHLFEHRTLTQSQMAYIVRTTGSTVRCFRSIFKGIR